MSRVKICGITRPEDAQLAVDGGAWALGFILWGRSPRAADPAVVAGLVRSLRRRVETVGVFVDPTLEEVVQAVDFLGLSMVQLHGDVGATFCSAVRSRAAVPVIRAFRVGSAADVQDADRFRAADFHLFDTRVGETQGGTGQTWEWDLAAQRRSDVPLVLAGGLTADNVGAGIASAQPFAVDVASGTESEPGVKDPDKLAAFLAAARAHERDDPAPTGQSA